MLSKINSLCNAPQKGVIIKRIYKDLGDGMSIKFHLYLCRAISFIVGGSALYFFYFILHFRALSAFFCMIPIYYIPRLLFVYIVHARCPTCGGTARQQPGSLISKYIRYACTTCGYRQQTDAAYF